MPKADPVRVDQIIPTFRVRDMQQAVEWYRDVMGWEIRLVALPERGGSTKPIRVRLLWFDDMRRNLAASNRGPGGPWLADHEEPRNPGVRPRSGSTPCEIDRGLAGLVEAIHAAAGEAFNIDSPKQLQAVLFQKLGLPRGRSTKTGFSTDADVLAEMVHLHPICPLLLQHRQLTNLANT